METVIEPEGPVTFGCTVDDVLRLLPGVTVVDGPVVGPSNPRYAGQGRVVSREDVEGFIVQVLSLIHISEPTRPERISYAVFCLKKKKKLLSMLSLIK